MHLCRRVHLAPLVQEAPQVPQEPTALRDPLVVLETPVLLERRYISLQFLSFSLQLDNLDWWEHYCISSQI